MTMTAGKDIGDAGGGGDNFGDVKDLLETGGAVGDERIRDEARGDGTGDGGLHASRAGARTRSIDRPSKLRLQARMDEKFRARQSTVLESISEFDQARTARIESLEQAVHSMEKHK